jgi:hypothetical protein
MCTTNTDAIALSFRRIGAAARRRNYNRARACASTRCFPRIQGQLGQQLPYVVSAAIPSAGDAAQSVRGSRSRSCSRSRGLGHGAVEQSEPEALGDVRGGHLARRLGRCSQARAGNRRPRFSRCTELNGHRDPLSSSAAAGGHFGESFSSFSSPLIDHANAGGASFSIISLSDSSSTLRSESSANSPQMQHAPLQFGQTNGFAASHQPFQPTTPDYSSPLHGTPLVQVDTNGDTPSHTTTSAGMVFTHSLESTPIAQTHSLVAFTSQHHAEDLHGGLVVDHTESISSLIRSCGGSDRSTAF